MTDCDPPLSDPNDDPALGAEIRALMGVFVLHTQIQATIEAVVPDDGLSTQARYLLIRLEQPQRLGDLARVSRLLPSTVTALADALEAAGLAQRARDPADRRAWLLSLTEAGAAKRAEIVTAASRLFREVSGLDETETRTFAALMDRVRNHIHDTMIKEGA